MFLERLTLVNYRNYDRLVIDLNEKMNIFAGYNAQGKTNIVESIYLLGLAKSHRTSRDKDMIKWDKEATYIKGECRLIDKDITIEIKIDRDIKKIRVNGVVLNKNSDLLGNFNVVIFSPEDLKLVKEGPSERRKFIDNEVSQIKPAYNYNLQQYNKVLLQRNNLIKDIKFNKNLINTLDIWDKQLIKYGAYIVFWRKIYLEKLVTAAKDIHKKITEEKEEINIEYCCSFDLLTGDDIYSIEHKFKKHINDNREKDLLLRATSVGPHRDDLRIYINDIDVKQFGSQGQQRTAALSLKLAELELIKAETGDYPILLLDDVMSELDQKRRKFLISSLNQVQMFITTTSTKELDNMLGENHYIYNVINGTATKK